MPVPLGANRGVQAVIDGRTAVTIVKQRERSRDGTQTITERLADLAPPADAQAIRVMRSRTLCDTGSRVTRLTG